MKPKVYIDGSSGTVGLNLLTLLRSHPYIEIIPPVLNSRNLHERNKCISHADLVIFCLPEKQINDSLCMVDEEQKVLDCSSLNRCDLNWVYGLPELGADQRKLISGSNRVSNPGCFALAFILLLKPLIDSEVLSPATVMSLSGINGYSAGGKRMIELFENGKMSSRSLGIVSEHKHLPEIMKYSGLAYKPLFMPSIGDHKEGLLISFPIMGREPDKIRSIYDQSYNREKYVNVKQSLFSSLNFSFKNSNILEVYVLGDEMNSIVFGRMSNLLKGAAGTAVQNVNLMLGFEEGLCL